MAEISDEQLEKLYDDFLEFAGNKSQSYPALAIASIMLTQSLSLYRAILPEDDYVRFLERIGSDRIPTFSFTTKKHTLQ